jgi:hypothetical protein
MKKIIILLVLTTWCFFAKAQETRVEKTISLSLPQGSEKPNDQVLSAYLKNRKNTQALKPDKFNGLTYKFGSIIFQINGDTGKFASNRLEQFKRNEDNLMSKIEGANYSSELKTINNNKVVIIKTQSKDYHYYRFMAINKDNNKVVFATMEYNEADEEKAKAILNHVLNKLRFK